MKLSFWVVLSLCRAAFGVDWIALEEPETIAKKAFPDGGDDASVKTYIVQFVDDPVSVHHETKPSKNRKLETRSRKVMEYVSYLERIQDEAVESCGGTKVWGYTYAFNGASIKLTEAEASRMAKEENVISVTPDEIRHVETESSASFSGFSGAGGPWSLGYSGEDIVVGIIDSGIIPEISSFSDVPTPINGDLGEKVPYGPPPEGFSGRECEFGFDNFNSNDAPFSCNNKLLTAQCFVAGYSQVANRNLPCGGDGQGIAPNEFLSARDADTHGTHTAGTAAGNFLEEAEVDGEIVKGISGMAPRARLAVYKPCWIAEGETGQTCFVSDIVAAIDKALADGVDVINYSFGSLNPITFSSADDLAFLNAADAGVFVATSAGNGGSGGSRTISSPAVIPWITAVGAGTDDGVVGTMIEILNPPSVAGNYSATEANSPVRMEDINATDITFEVVVADPPNACEALNNGDLSGKVVLVIRGGCLFVDKFNFTANAGASVILVYNDGTEPDRFGRMRMNAENTTIPGLFLSHDDGSLLVSALNETTVSFSYSTVSEENRVASFSSRGPNAAGAASIIKPDIIAPGVDILAAGDDSFITMSGTSMASPHVAGLFALLKQAHPTWTAAMAKSAIMTSARQDITIGDDNEPSTPFDIGSGHIVPSGAFNPGLVYDTGFFEYIGFLCDVEPSQLYLCQRQEVFDIETVSQSNLNYPSIGVEKFLASKTIVRTVTCVTESNSTETFEVSIDAPLGLSVVVTPDTLTLSDGESATYEVVLSSANGLIPDEWAFGSLTWRSVGNTTEYSIRSPIAVFVEEYEAPTKIVGNNLTGSVSFDIEFGYTGSYSADFYGFNAAIVQEDLVEEGSVRRYNFNRTDGVRRFEFEFEPTVGFVRFSLFDQYTDGNHDLDLYVWECTHATLGERGGCIRVGRSTSSTSDEEVDLINPDSTKVYIVDVFAYETQGPDARFFLYAWAPDSNAGNAQINAPATAQAGAILPITIDWSVVESNSLGVVIHTGLDGRRMGHTIITIED